MRVLQIIPSLTVGGAERMVAALTHHLRSWGHEVTVVSMYAPRGSWIEAALRAEEVPLHFLGKRPGLDLRMVPRIEHVVRGFCPDVVHTHMYTLKYALPALLRHAGCCAVHTVHTLAAAEADRWSRLLLRFAFRGRVVPVAIGGAVAESLCATYGQVRHVVIPNGIPIPSRAPAPGMRQAMRTALGIPAEAPTFVAVGMLNPAKNHEALLAAFASEHLRAAGAHLLLVGDGELRGALEERARALGMSDRVRFLGVRDDVPDLLAAGDAFVLSSRREGNPLSVMEAMAAGRPVIATAVGCIPELVPPGTGRLVPPDDVDALARAMAELAGSPSLAGTWGSAAARLARERFDSSTMARAYETLYERRRRDP